MLTKEKIDAYRLRLEKEKEDLLNEIKAGEKSLDFGDEISDPEDEEADEAEEQGNQMGIEKVLRERISQIDLALQRIQEGTYGTCAKCGAPISEKILDIAPESSLCENCKKES